MSPLYHEKTLTFAIKPNLDDIGERWKALSRKKRDELWPREREPMLKRQKERNATGSTLPERLANMSEQDATIYLLQLQRIHDQRISAIFDGKKTPDFTESIPVEALQFLPLPVSEAEYDIGERALERQSSGSPVRPITPEEIAIEGLWGRYRRVQHAEDVPKDFAGYIRRYGYCDSVFESAKIQALLANLHRGEWNMKHPAPSFQEVYGDMANNREAYIAIKGYLGELITYSTFMRLGLCIESRVKELSRSHQSEAEKMLIPGFAFTDRRLDEDDKLDLIMHLHEPNSSEAKYTIGLQCSTTPDVDLRKSKRDSFYNQADRIRKKHGIGSLCYVDISNIDVMKLTHDWLTARKREGTPDLLLRDDHVRSLALELYKAAPDLLSILSVQELVDDWKKRYPH